MSCRRNDRARFIGCRVGPVRIRGCDRGCCPYPSSETESNERWNYATDRRPGIQFDHSVRYPHHPSIAPSGNHACKTSRRPKFVCVACRRAFKAALIEGNQYDIWASSWHMGWWYSPLPSRIPEVWKEYDSICSLPARREEKKRLQEIESMVLSGRREGKTFSDEEMSEYKKSNPALWWEPLSALRCPGCGEAGVPVGGTFRAPPQKDSRGWTKVSELLAKGEKFSYCLTQDEEALLIKDAEIEMGRRRADAGMGRHQSQENRGVEKYFGENRRRDPETGANQVFENGGSCTRV
ncbi:hypothetical protein B0H19DRAFT_1131238 [Mycena capillaripes]|nr:hypothetical protein B0H19DRAFT_1131238 [Mycena capillaripes]